MNTRECYRILAADPGCTWEDLRTAYRRQVQKWHPDRYQQQPELAAEAAQRMLKVNAAFEQLAAYFERHGELPLKPPPAARPARGRRAAADDEHAPRRARPTDRGRAVGVWLTLLVLGAIAYYASRPPDGPPGEAAPVPQPAPAGAAAAPRPPKRYAPPFGFGDRPGDVFAAQGVPTRTAGDIWYYGNSEVHFERGAVVQWFSAPDHPLNTRATSSPILGDTRVDKPGKK